MHSNVQVMFKLWLQNDHLISPLRTRCQLKSLLKSESWFLEEKKETPNICANYSFIEGFHLLTFFSAIVL